ncbi:GNAT family N-acetyltransferase [Heyndrickxia ginsengihumi]|uniref:GNAT family N-acetyltransferase n=1 Tax=Heyndrickxia ginsengihumi TaxID=363870 RepID=A0A0A6V802_9BACI|nr:GNAT family N-acetyltransferase [Heyndrickxia ginsengihumi]KHD84185.1 hypothetical protein NG54_17150 [Heyndrickxia ginsengihumi]MBE6184972.1 GNAT family N-acetyltransferase [Bacillus sp. (in: firmicutes)]MCM3024702.1 GNAT family N-acetyltransferase [Heyndrickxia ginsengihumi]NEY21585.1 GNAT family N-acetyltransferase [Heyndrickxia ginsengihumi]
MIRDAKIEDWKEVMQLLEQLDYPNTQSFLKDKIKRLLHDPNEELLVYEHNGKVIALISIHFIPQIALEGDFARISYFIVDQSIRSKGIGQQIEKYCTELAQKKQCDRIEVHCHASREEAHRFYARQGYIESPKYFIKKICY